MLYFIGLGLADEKDITVKGLEVVKNASRVYLEAYTAILLVEKDKLVSYIPQAPSQASIREISNRAMYEMFTTTSRKLSMAEA
jgi:diphthamide biosynthesis methyltransferase